MKRMMHNTHVCVPATLLNCTIAGATWCAPRGGDTECLVAYNEESNGKVFDSIKFMVDDITTDVENSMIAENVKISFVIYNTTC